MTKAEHNIVAKAKELLGKGGDHASVALNMAYAIGLLDALLSQEVTEG